MKRLRVHLQTMADNNCPKRKRKLQEINDAVDGLLLCPVADTLSTKIMKCLPNNAKYFVWGERGVKNFEVSP